MAAGIPAVDTEAAECPAVHQLLPAGRLAADIEAAVVLQEAVVACHMIHKTAYCHLVHDRNIYNVSFYFPSISPNKVSVFFNISSFNTSISLD